MSSLADLLGQWERNRAAKYANQDTERNRMIQNAMADYLAESSKTPIGKEVPADLTKAAPVTEYGYAEEPDFQKARELAIIANKPEVAAAIDAMRQERELAKMNVMPKRSGDRYKGAWIGQNGDLWKWDTVADAPYNVTKNTPDAKPIPPSVKSDVTDAEGNISTYDVPKVPGGKITVIPKGEVSPEIEKQVKDLGQAESEMSNAKTAFDSLDKIASKYGYIPGTGFLQNIAQSDVFKNDLETQASSLINFIENDYRHKIFGTAQSKQESTNFVNSMKSGAYNNPVALFKAMIHLRNVFESDYKSQMWQDPRAKAIYEKNTGMKVGSENLPWVKRREERKKQVNLQQQTPQNQPTTKAALQQKALDNYKVHQDRGRVKRELEAIKNMNIP